MKKIERKCKRRKSVPQAKRDFKSVVILGPTASGKSAFALSLAKRLNGTIICADSLQMYKGLPLLTAQPTEGDKQGVPHLLYEHFDAMALRSSVAAWRTLAMEALEEVLGAVRIPIFVGGTGFYVKALLDGLSHIPDVSTSTIKALELMDTKDLAEALKRDDPGIAERLHLKDRQRMVRALSVLKETGRSLSFWQNQKGASTRKHFCVVSLCPDVRVIDQNIRDRLEDMMDAGVIGEITNFAHSVWGKRPLKIPPINTKGLAPKTTEIVQILTSLYPRPWPSVTRALGFAELLMALHGGLTFESAKDLVMLRTRQYAKRQRTWLRHQVDADIRLDSANAEKLTRLSKML